MSDKTKPWRGRFDCGEGAATEGSVYHQQPSGINVVGSDPIQAAQAAVVERAVAVFNPRMETAYRLPRDSRGNSRPVICVRAVCELYDAVDHLRSLQPKGLPPEDAPLGCTFEFATKAQSRESTGPFRLVSLYGNTRMYLDDNNEVYDFNKGELIIPEPNGN